MRLSIRKRMEFVESRLFWEGAISRKDITDCFGISNPQASKDLKQYSELAPDNIYYDSSVKQYLATKDFVPKIITPTCESYFSELLISNDTEESFICGEIPQHDIVPVPLRKTDPLVLRDILKAIRESSIIEILYQSMSSPDPGLRDISPHALVNDGFRWHVRAYCHKRKEYRDFNLSRIIKCGEFRFNSINHSNDLLWHNFVVFKLAPHPKLNDNQKRCIEHEYGMIDGVCDFKVRGAFVFYVKQRLGLHQLPEEKPPYQQQIILTNREDVDNTIDVLNKLQANKLGP